MSFPLSKDRSVDPRTVNAPFRLALSACFFLGFVSLARAFLVTPPPRSVSLWAGCGIALLVASIVGYAKAWRSRAEGRAVHRDR